MMRNIPEPQWDAARTSNTEILHFRDEEESDGGRGDERPERPSDLRQPIKSGQWHWSLHDRKKRGTYGGGPLAETKEAHS